MKRLQAIAVVVTKRLAVVPQVVATVEQLLGLIIVIQNQLGWAVVGQLQVIVTEQRLVAGKQQFAIEVARLRPQTQSQTSS